MANLLCMHNSRAKLLIHIRGLAADRSQHRTCRNATTLKINQSQLSVHRGYQFCEAGTGITCHARTSAQRFHRPSTDLIDTIKHRCAGYLIFGGDKSEKQNCKTDVIAVCMRCARFDVARGHLVIDSEHVGNNDMMCPFGPRILVRLIPPTIAAADVSYHDHIREV
jgi:hypothetical protein